MAVLIFLYLSHTRTEECAACSILKKTERARA